MALEYKDEKGRVLKGFSQVDLDLLNKKVQDLIWILLTFIIWFMILISWLIYYVIHNDVVNNIVAACIK